MKTTKQWLIPLIMVIIASTDAFTDVKNKKTCEPITNGLCKFSSNTGYAATLFPNDRYRTQVEASQDLAAFRPLIKVNCHRDVGLFLCAYHIPLCIENLKMALQPCRSLCENVRNGCSKLMENYGFSWPFNCTEFSSSEAMCVSGSKQAVTTTTTTSVISGNVTIPTTAIPTNKTQKGKSKKKRGKATGKEGDQVELKCKKGQRIIVKKVAHKNSKCCPSISKQILNIMCHQKRTCKFTVDKSTFGGHCLDMVGTVAIRYKCDKKTKKQSNSDALCPAKG